MTKFTHYKYIGNALNTLRLLAIFNQVIYITHSNEGNHRVPFLTVIHLFVAINKVINNKYEISMFSETQTHIRKLDKPYDK